MPNGKLCPKTLYPEAYSYILCARAPPRPERGVTLTDKSVWCNLTHLIVSDKSVNLLLTCSSTRIVKIIIENRTCNSASSKYTFLLRPHSGSQIKMIRRGTRQEEDILRSTLMNFRHWFPFWKIRLDRHEHRRAKSDILRSRKHNSDVCQLSRCRFDNWPLSFFAVAASVPSKSMIWSACWGCP